MSRGTQNTLLLLVGLSALVMVVKGTYLHFVKPSLLPWLIAAAVVLIALAVASIVRDLRHAPADDGDSGEGHRHRRYGRPAGSDSPVPRAGCQLRLHRQRHLVPQRRRDAKAWTVRLMVMTSEGASMKICVYGAGAVGRGGR